jgi:hypothetical protein
MYLDRKKLCKRQLKAGKTRGRATFHVRVLDLVIIIIIIIGKDTISFMQGI